MKVSKATIRSSVADSDPYVFGPTGPGSVRGTGTDPARDPSIIKQK
jgi:hypothetical protein